MGLPPDLYGKKLSQLRWDNELGPLLLSGSEFRNRLCTLREQGRSLTVSKEKINKGDHRRDLYILLIKDITELTNLETSLRRQIDKPTLIIGESGTGKELFAQSIHNASSRARFPFVAMNCAAIPPTLLESELFGYDEGAFTGAKRGGKEGLFQMAQKGTLFLDEIGELSLPTQAKLLRVLEEKEIMKVGSGELIGVDVRIIAATNRDLNALVDAGEFRLDLYYRLNTLIINVPPLRDRRSDIPLLIRAFLQQERLDPVEFDPTVWRFLMDYNWKGNIRELRNCVEYMANISDGVITMEHLPDYMLSHPAGPRPEPSPLAAGPWPGEDQGLVRDILLLLAEKPLGRRALLLSLSQQGGQVTEYHLRWLLTLLQEQGYLTLGRGRAGCALTVSGRSLLKALADAP